MSEAAEVLCESCGRGRPASGSCIHCGAPEPPLLVERSWSGRVRDRPADQAGGRLPGMTPRTRTPGWSLVVYFIEWELRASDRRELERLFDVPFVLDGLPFETPSYSGETLARLARECPGNHWLIWQKSILTPMAEDRARSLADAAVREQYEVPDEPPREEARDAVWAYDLDRCWAFLYYSGPFIPPGIGCLVDKRSERVFLRRYIDLEPTLSALGYATPEPIFEE